MKNEFSKTNLHNAMNRIIIPSKERVLPEQALSRKTNTRTFLRPVILKSAAVAFSLLLVVALTITPLLNLGIDHKLPGLPIVTGRPENSDTGNSDGTNSSDKDSARKVITAEFFDTSESNLEEIPRRSEIYISNSLKEQMEKYQGQDVLFRVIAEFLITFEDYNEYQPTAANAEELKRLERERDRTVDELETARRELEGKENSENRSYYAEIYDDKDKQATAAYKEWSDLSLLDRKAYNAEILSKRYEYAVSINAENIIDIKESSDIPSYTISGVQAYFMDLTKEMIDSMAAQGGYAFRLAPPARIDGYSPKLSDYITYLLDGISEEESIHVAVVLGADRHSRFAQQRNLLFNSLYNNEYFKPWQGSAPPKIIEYKDDVAITEDGTQAMELEEYVTFIASYVDEIVERNGLINKRIINENAPDAYYGKNFYEEYTNPVKPGNNPPDYSSFVDYFTTGFEAELTKTEILSLLDDDEVKIIYSMELIGIDDPFNSFDD